MAGDLLKIEVDPGDVLTRRFTDIEQRQLPFVLMQTANRTADEVKFQWDRLIRRLDQPVPLTLRAVRVNRARFTRNGNGSRSSRDGAEVYIQNDAPKGTPPSRYLQPLVFGGAGHAKGIDRGLQRAGILGPGQFAIPAHDNTLLDARGNIRQGVVPQILSQLGGQFDALANETATSKKRNTRRGKRRYFAVTRNNPSRRSAHLSPGIYWRDGQYDLTKVFHFVDRAARYNMRLDIFRSAQKAFNNVFPFHFDNELRKALETSKFRGRA
jgi:hypothetical protein